jgi:hypothetical protein
MKEAEIGRTGYARETFVGKLRLQRPLTDLVLKERMTSKFILKQAC